MLPLYDIRDCCSVGLIIPCINFLYVMIIIYMGAVFSGCVCFLQRSSTHDPELQSKLASLARQALERAEELKGILPPVEDKSNRVSVAPKLCAVPEHTSSSATVRATSTPNRGKVLCC
jgi:hypothetical protein